MANFFSSENAIWRPLSFIADVVILSAFWMLCSLPIFTMGAATTALYDCAARCVRGDDKAMISRFFRTFKREFVPSLLSSVLWGVILAAGFLLIRTFGNSVSVSQGSTVATVAMLFVLSIVVGIACWELPLLSRFTFSFGQLTAATVKLGLGNIIRTVPMGILTVIGVWFSVRYIVPLIFMPALIALLWTVFLETVFQKYEKMQQQTSLPEDSETE